MQWAVIALMCWLGCAGSKKDGAEDELEDATSTDLSPDVAKFVDALCRRIVACSDEVPQVSSKQGCARLLVSLVDCSPKLADLELEGVDACITSIEESSCEQVGSDPLAMCPDVARAFTSTGGEARLGLGAVCGGREDGYCSDGLACTGPYGKCGTCVLAPAAGQDCLDALCAGGAYCNDQSKCEPLRKTGAECEVGGQCQSDACRNGRCVYAKRGDVCGDKDEDACGSSMNCVEGKCAASQAIGAPCSEKLACTDDAMCINGKCALLAACGEGTEDDACWSSAECVTGLSCGYSFTWDAAACAPPAKRGESCAGFRACEDDLICTQGTDPEPTCEKNVPDEGDPPARCPTK